MGTLTHGMYRTRTYRAWESMIQRCTNPNNIGYAEYRDRAPPERWSDFANFFADMGEVPEGMTLDRIDNSLPYGPGNCKWATQSEQNRNYKRNVQLVHPEHGRHCFRDACTIQGINYWSAKTWYRRNGNKVPPKLVGWTLEEKQGE